MQERSPLSSGEAHYLAVVVADGLDTLAAQRGVRSISDQLALLSSPSFLVDLRRFAGRHVYGAVASTCSDRWLCAMTLVFNIPTLLQAEPGWTLAGSQPSPEVFNMARALCASILSFQDLMSLVRRLEGRK